MFSEKIKTYRRNKTITFHYPHYVIYISNCLITNMHDLLLILSLIDNIHYSYVFCIKILLIKEDNFIYWINKNQYWESEISTIAYHGRKPISLLKINLYLTQIFLFMSKIYFFLNSKLHLKFEQ